MSDEKVTIEQLRQMQEAIAPSYLNNPIDPLATLDPLEWAQAYRFMEQRITDLENGKGKIGRMENTIVRLNNRITALEAQLARSSKKSEGQ